MTFLVPSVERVTVRPRPFRVTNRIFKARAARGRTTGRTLVYHPPWLPLPPAAISANPASTLSPPLQKIEALLEDHADQRRHLDSETWSLTYNKVYELCTQKPPHDYSERLYASYAQAFDRYVETGVAPRLRAQMNSGDEVFLTELVRRWSNHVLYTRFMAKFFHYLDRYYVPRHSLDHLDIVPALGFRRGVFEPNGGTRGGGIYLSARLSSLRLLLRLSLHPHPLPLTSLLSTVPRARDAILAALRRDRAGEAVDAALCRQAVALFVRMGLGQDRERYGPDLETPIIEDAAQFWKERAAEWLSGDDKCGVAEYCRRAPQGGVERKVAQTCCASA